MSRRSSRTLAVASVLCGLVITGAAWLASTRTDPPIAASITANENGEAGELVGPGGSAAPAANGSETVVRDLARIEPAAPARWWNVQLRGLRAGLPWTGTVRLRIVSPRYGVQRKLTVETATDGDGCCRFAVPEWWSEASSTHLATLDVDDPNYVLVARPQEADFATPGDITVDVLATATVGGRVVARDGTPIETVRVAGRELRDGVPADREIAAAVTNASGEWRLRVTRELPLWLVATAMESNRSTVRVDLLPATTVVASRFDSVVQLPDLVLHEPSLLTGVVTSTDGAPIAGAVVEGSVRDARRLDGEATVFLHRDGRVSTICTDRADRFGRFELTTLPAAVYDVQLTHLGGATGIVVGPRITQSAAATDHVVLRVPRSVVARTTYGGRAAAGATIELEGSVAKLRADDQGCFRFVPTTTVRIRAVHGALRSPWCDVAPSAAGGSIALELTGPIDSSRER